MGTIGATAKTAYSDSKVNGQPSTFVLQSGPEEKNRYGWLHFTPAILQPIFNNAKAFLFFVTLSNVIQGMLVNGLMKVNVTSIERHFKLFSSESGFIVSSYDIAGCLCLLPISYIGGRGHKPQWISVGVLFLGVGSLILCLPNFIPGKYEYKPLYRDTNGDNEAGLCKNNAQVNDTSINFPGDYREEDVDYSSFRSMQYVFIFGQFLIGMGSTPLSILAVTMIDESVNQQVYPIHIGIFYLGALVGPALGFILGGKLLTIFTDLSRSPQDITPANPMWVGAWWVGFLISGALSFILCIPLFGYPKKLPTPSGKLCQWNMRVLSQEGSNDVMELQRKDFNDDAIKNPGEEEPALPSVSFRDLSSEVSSTVSFTSFYRDVISVLSNKAFMFLSLSAAIFSTLVSGFSTFGPKFIESQLGKSAADAANLFGYVCIPAGASGMLIGAFLMAGLKMSHKSSLQMCIAVSLFSLLAHFVLILDCKDSKIAGITVPYANNASSNNLSDFCNADCKCNHDSRYNPVCGSNGITYFSPCYAGCMSYVGSNEYRNCTCTGLSSVKSGVCEKKCSWETLILFSLFLIILSVFLCTIPGVDLSLRCFPNSQRSLAIGIQWILIRTLGTIPGPILFGTVIDSTCFLKSDGSCLLYNNSDLSWNFLLLSVLYKVAGIVFLSLALLYIHSCTVEAVCRQRTIRSSPDVPSLNHAGHDDEFQMT